MGGKPSGVKKVSYGCEGVKITICWFIDIFFLGGGIYVWCVWLVLQYRNRIRARKKRNKERINRKTERGNGE